MGFIEDAKELLEKELSFKKRKCGFELINSKSLAKLKKAFAKLQDAANEIQELLVSLEEKEAPEAKTKASKKKAKRKVAFGLGSDEPKKKRSKKTPLNVEKKPTRSELIKEDQKRRLKKKLKEKRMEEPAKKLSPSERMKDYWKKRKARELPEQVEADESEVEEIGEEEIEEEEPGIVETIVDDATKAKIKENLARLDKLQEKVQGELQNALSFKAQKALVAMKKGATRLREIAKESKLNYTGLNHILAELEEKGLITKVSFGTYALIEEPKENGKYSKERD
jgi:hypothetical protein